jgi:hypothetical protein
VARKNGNGEGSRPRQRADGRWEARYWAGEKRRSVYGSTRKEAADKLAKALANDEEPRTTSTTPNITVREFFAHFFYQCRLGRMNRRGYVPKTPRLVYLGADFPPSR